MNFMKIMNHTLSMFNSGQITLPKKWRSKFKTTKFVAYEKGDQLIIKPLKIPKEDIPEELRDENVELYENIEDGEKVSGIRFKKGLSGESLEYFQKKLRNA